MDNHFHTNPIPVKEIVEKIIQEEEASRQAIERARQEAQDLLRQAQEEANRLIEQLQEEAHAHAGAEKERSQQDFLLQKQKALQETFDTIFALRKEKEKDIPALSRKLFSRIIQIKD